MEQNILIDKIKKLLALQSSPNKAEAELAAIKVNELLTKYNLSLSDIQDNSFSTPLVEVKVDNSTRNKSYRRLIQYVAHYYYCATLYQPKFGKSYFLGRKHNIEVCIIMLDYLYNVIKRETAKLDKMLGKSYKHNFKTGMIEEIGVRLRKMRLQQQQDNHVNALVISEKKLIEDYLQEKNIKQQQVKERLKDQLAFEHGRFVGRNISLNEQVGHNKNKEIRKD